MDISEIWPPFALHLQSDDMELSPVSEADIPELAQIARGGVRRDGIEAFLVDWDSGTDEQVARSLAQYHWSTRAKLTADEWTIEFTVRVNGRTIGVQGVNGHRFPLTRTVSTGSWLALPEQGRGYGTRMRRMIIEGVTRYLAAAQSDTAYFDGNRASRRVSEKLGYSPNGNRNVVGQNGTALTKHHMAPRSEDYVHTGRDLQVTGAEAFRTFPSQLLPDGGPATWREVAAPPSGSTKPDQHTHTRIQAPHPRVNKKKRPCPRPEDQKQSLPQKILRQSLTLPQPPSCSTISANGLSYRDRNG